jgi:hypothetical protein
VILFIQHPARKVCCQTWPVLPQTTKSQQKHKKSTKTQKVNKNTKHGMRRKMIRITHDNGHTFSNLVTRETKNYNKTTQTKKEKKKKKKKKGKTIKRLYSCSKKSFCTIPLQNATMPNKNYIYYKIK